MTSETYGTAPAADEHPVADTPKRGACFGVLDFQGVQSAKAWCYCAIARGAFLTAYLWIAASFQYLASEDAGCVDEEGKLIPDCSGKVYGIRPDSILTLITTLTGILSALLMPVTGAIVDYTTYRKRVGIMSAAAMTLIQTLCAFTFSQTWFPMAILTAFGGFLNEVQFVSYSSYLPEIARTVGEGVMTKFVSSFFISQMLSQLVYMITTIAVSVFIPNPVMLAHITQAINAVWIGTFFYIGWKVMPSVPAKHTLPPGRNLVIVGFEQNWKTFQMVNKHYTKGLRYFFLSALMGDNALTNASAIAISFFGRALQMNATSIGTVILAVLFFTIPGAKISTFVCAKTNPVTSMKLALLLFFVTTAAASFVLQSKDQKNLSYVFTSCWGISIGWFFPTENLLFSMLVPKNYETELSGFFAYSTQIIGWAPPLLYTYLNEAGYAPGWGLLSLNIWVILGIGPLFFYADWDECVAEAKKEINEEVVTKKEDAIDNA